MQLALFLWLGANVVIAQFQLKSCGLVRTLFANEDGMFTRIFAACQLARPHIKACSKNPTEVYLLLNYKFFSALYVRFSAYV